MVQHRLKTHYGVQPKRRRPQNKIVATLAPTTTYHIKDGEMIDEQVRSLDFLSPFRQDTVAPNEASLFSHEVDCH